MPWGERLKSASEASARSTPPAMLTPVHRPAQGGGGQAGCEGSGPTFTAPPRTRLRPDAPAGVDRVGAGPPLRVSAGWRDWTIAFPRGGPRALLFRGCTPALAAPAPRPSPAAWKKKVGSASSPASASSRRPCGPCAGQWDASLRYEGAIICAKSGFLVKGREGGASGASVEPGVRRCGGPAGHRHLGVLLPLARLRYATLRRAGPAPQPARKETRGQAATGAAHVHTGGLMSGSCRCASRSSSSIRAPAPAQGHPHSPPPRLTQHARLTDASRHRRPQPPRQPAKGATGSPRKCRVRVSTWQTAPVAQEERPQRGVTPEAPSPPFRRAASAPCLSKSLKSRRLSVMITGRPFLCELQW
jgi:hypothetical protein